MEENKIWANLNDSYNLDIILIENQNLKDYIPKKETYKEEFKKVDTIVNVEEIVNGIISNDFTSNNVLEILSKQNIVASYLLKLFRNLKSEDVVWEKFKPGLAWILQSSKFITSKTNTFIQIFKTDKIYRSSYKFCNKKDECEGIYCNLIKSKSDRVGRCNGDHYVHNKLVSDLTCLITVLETKIDNISNDLRVCLDTVNFVINHMYQELNTFSIYHSKQVGFDINKYYITSVPLKRK
jgi:hypothetical protein